MKKFDLSSWPVLIVSGQINEKNDEGTRLRELIANLETQQGCSVTLSLTYHDALEVFQSRTDLGAVLVDWDIDEKFMMASKLDGEELIDTMRKRNKTIPIWLLTERLIIEKIPVNVLEKINGYLWKTADTPDYLAGRVRMQVWEYAVKVLPDFFEKLVDYVNEYKYAWHTPGHMGGEGFLRSPAGVAFYKFFGEDVMRADLSISVPELGSLLDHSGPTGDAEKASARTFGADYTYYVLNGTSTANQIIWRSQVCKDEPALVDRNCHKSLNYAMIITEARPTYMKPRRNKLGIIGPVRLSEFGPETESNENGEPSRIGLARKVKMSALTNSTYDGVCYNVMEIKRRLEKRAENLHFDEAWYAYAKFHPIYKNHFGMSTADIPCYTNIDHPPVFCSQSTHKLLTAFSQASMIHIKNGNEVKIDPDLFNESYMMHGSTSPQYNMIASLDVATKMMADNGEIILEDILIEAIQLRKKVAAIFNGLKENDWFFHMWQPEKLGVSDVSMAELLDQKTWTMKHNQQWHGFDLDKNGDEDNYVMLDPIKLTFVCPGIDSDGNLEDETQTPCIPAAVVTNYLIGRGIVCEKTDYYSWLMLNSLGTTKGRQGTLLAELFKFKELYNANTPLVEVFPEMVAQYPQYRTVGLKDHCNAIHHYFREYNILDKMNNAFESIPDQVMKPSEAFQNIVQKNVESVRLENIVGRVPAVMIVPYPPGIPIMMGGEKMDRKVREYLKIRQDFENQFPGYESDIHGVERVTAADGKKYFEIYCIIKD
ncbi:MAG: Orn/Lys/Arg decarboxylase N-terminal domain-containing protein [Candidatus Omnitrophota bacterium]